MERWQLWNANLSEDNMVGIRARIRIECLARTEWCQTIIKVISTLIQFIKNISCNSMRRSASLSLRHAACLCASSLVIADNNIKVEALVGAFSSRLGTFKSAQEVHLSSMVNIGLLTWWCPSTSHWRGNLRSERQQYWWPPLSSGSVIPSMKAEGLTLRRVEV